MRYVVLVVFVLTYLLLIAFPKRKVFFAGCSAAFMLLTGAVPFSKMFAAIDWNVLLMIFGTGGVVLLFIDSKAPEFLGDHIIRKAPDVKWATISLALFAGVISAFLENVSTLLIVAPVAFEISRKLKISPAPMLITIAVSSNLQGAATLVGDPTSIMLGGHADMNFMDFFFMRGRPGIFFAVEIGALASLVVMYFMFRKASQPIHVSHATSVKDKFPSYLLAGLILTLICVSFIPNRPRITNGLICFLALALGVFREYFAGNRHKALEIFRGTDWHTIGLLACLFIMINAIIRIGVVDVAAGFLAEVGQGNVFLLYSAIVWGSVAASAFIDNIPFVATMLPVVSALAGTLGIPPYLFYFGLLSGATLGGNISPIGASTNIAALGLLRKKGYHVGFLKFAGYGLPLTLAAVTAGYVFLWVVWS